jgi:hypothetical protein
MKPAMKYIPTIETGKYSKAIAESQMVLQSGQWIQCGEGAKSRFHSVTPNGIIIAFHGATAKEATRKYQDYVWAQRAEKAAAKARALARQIEAQLSLDL